MINHVRGFRLTVINLHLMEFYPILFAIVPRTHYVPVPRVVQIDYRLFNPGMLSHAHND